MASYPSRFRAQVRLVFATQKNFVLKFPKTTSSTARGRWISRTVSPNGRVSVFLYYELTSDTRVEHKGGVLVEETSGECHLMGGQDGKEGQLARPVTGRDADFVLCRSQKEEEAKQ